MRKINALLLVLVLLVTSIPVAVYADNPTTGINWGANITESISGDTLTLSGTGAVANFAERANEDKLSKLGVTSVVIGEGIPSIGANAFSANELTSVAIPNSVTSIGTLAFGYNKLTSVTIPSGVSILGVSAFFANDLTSVIISNGVETISSRAFAYNDLTSLAIPNSVTNIGNLAFYNSQITSVTMERALISLGTDILSSDDNFKNAYLNIEAGGVGTYKGTPGGEWGKVGVVDTIAYDAKVAEVNALVESDYTPDSWSSYQTAIASVDLTLTSPNTQIAIDAEVVKIQEALDLLAVKPTTGILWGSDITESINGNTLTLSGTGVMNNFTGLDNKDKLSNKGIKFVVIGEGITTIGEYAFASNDLETVTLPSTLTEIGRNALTLNKLTSMIIPGSVTIIDFAAFMSNNMTSITMESSGVTIGSDLFGGGQDTYNSFKEAYETDGAGTYVGTQSGSISGTWTKELSDAEKLALDRASVQTEINNLVVTNSTTNSVMYGIGSSASSYATNVALLDFDKINATSTSTGSVTGTIRLTLNSEVEDIPFNKTIAQLPSPVVSATGFSLAESSTYNGVVSGEGDSLTYILQTGPQYGALTFNVDGSFTYSAHRQPTVGFVGSDTFTFSARDSGNQESNIANVSIAITPVNDAPVATSKSITANIGVETNGNVSATDLDGDELNYGLVTSPKHGTLTFNSDGSYCYTATDDTQNSDSFVFKANDGLADSTDATVTITLVPTIDTRAPILIAGAVNRTSNTEGTIKFTSDESGTYYYKVVADGATAPIINTTGAGIACTTAETTITNPTGLTAGAKDIYIVVKDDAGNLSEIIKIDIAAYVAPDTTAPILTSGVVNRTSNTEGTVKFTSDESGSYYYEIVADGAEAPTIDTSGAGIACTTAETTITNPTGLTAGAKDIYIVVKDDAGNVSDIIKIDIANYTAPSSGGSSGGSPSDDSSNEPVTPTPKDEPVVIVVNGEKQNAGKETKTSENGQSIVTITVNNKTVEEKVDEAIKNNKTGATNSIQLLFTDTTSDVAKVELTGDMVKKLENNSFNVSVKRDMVEYVIPAEEFAISSVAKNLDVLESNLVDIKLEVQISTLDDAVVKKFNEVAKANDSELVFPPVSFEVVAKTRKADGIRGQVVIGKFSNYVQRVMEISEGVDPKTVTTGVVFNQDGTYSHVPTTVYQKDGKWFASLSSLTNSNYSVIWNQIIVKSVENHWAKESVNDMASRLVIFEPEKFKPNQAITRADFAEYLVRALGIYREDSIYENQFTDVTSTGDRTLAILIANEYEIVSGYTDGTFRPNASITREEAMSMYQRAMKMTKLTGDDLNRFQNYKDFETVSPWAESYVKEVLSAHVFNGTTATTLSPKSTLTYAEAAQAIKNLLVESKLIND